MMLRESLPERGKLHRFSPDAALVCPSERTEKDTGLSLVTCMEGSGTDEKQITTDGTPRHPRSIAEILRQMGMVG